MSLINWVCTESFSCTLPGLQQFLAAALCLCDTFSVVLMLERHLTAKRADEPSAPFSLPGNSNGWLDSDWMWERRGEKGEEQCWGRVRENVVSESVSYPDPMAASLLCWMKASRPDVVAVTNLLRFSAWLEARGRGPTPPQPHPTNRLPLTSPSTLSLWISAPFACMHPLHLAQRS